MKLRQLGIAILIFATIPLLGQESESLGDLARRLRAEKGNAAPGQTTTTEVAAVAPGDEGPREGADFAALVAGLIHREQFEALDNLATTIRERKSRFQGGGWKLYSLYMSMCWQACDSDEQSQATIRRLKRWVAERPDSVTARIALTDAYVAYAWNARGTGYASEVDPDNWKRFEQRMLVAEKTLREAEELKEKCPHWYFVAEKVGRGRGWELEELTRSANKALASEPLYYYIYKEHVGSLEPRWYGKAGDSERYAKQVADHIGGTMGDVIYFEIATSLFHCKSCEDVNARIALMSWPRIRRGYDSDVKLYGTAQIKLNEFAYLAYRVGDRPLARKLFLQIGSDWMEDTWQTQNNFDAARIWVLGQ